MADLFLVDQQVGVLEVGFHLLGVGGKVGGEVAAVELHALDHLQGGLHGLGLFHGDDAFFTHLVHGLGDDVADGGVVVGADGADLGDLFLVLGSLGNALQLGHHALHRACQYPA